MGVKQVLTRPTHPLELQGEYFQSVPEDSAKNVMQHKQEIGNQIVLSIL